MIVSKEDDKAWCVIVSKEEDNEDGSAAVVKEDNEAKIGIVMNEDNNEAGFASVSGAPAPSRTIVSAPVPRPPAGAQGTRSPLPLALPAATCSDVQRQIRAMSTLFPPCLQLQEIW